MAAGIARTAVIALMAASLALSPRAWAQAAAPPAPASMPDATPPTIDGDTALARTRELVRPSRGRGCADPVPGEIQVCARRNTARLTEAERAVAGIGTATGDGIPRATDGSLGPAPLVGSGPFVDSRLPPNWQSIGGVINRAVAPNAAFDQLQRITADPPPASSEVDPEAPPPP